MNEFEQARSYGIIDIPTWMRCCFRVFLDQHYPVPVQTSEQPVRAYWSGSVIVVEMENGEIRRYHGLSESSFTIVYR